MAYIRDVNPNVEIKKFCVLGYRRVVVLPYLVAPVENTTGLGAWKLDGSHPVSVYHFLLHLALAPDC